MTVYPLGKLHIDQTETALQSTLRFAALLLIMLLIAVLAFAVVNAALPMLAEMRIQGSVNALNAELLTPQRHLAQQELENAGEAALPALIAALNSSNPTLRRNSAEMLGFIASPTATNALVQSVLNDPVAAVRSRAAWALGEANDVRALDSLTHASVMDKSLPVRQEAGASIAALRSHFANTAGKNEQNVYAFALAPSQTNVVYLAEVRALSKSRDGGKTWTPVSGRVPGWVTALAVSPSNPNVIYAGTDSLGIYKSTDAGTTWAAMNRGLGLDAGVRLVVNAITFDPKNSERVYVTTGVWVGTSHMNLLEQQVMQSIDGGTSWQVYRASTNVEPITQLVIQGERLYGLAGNQVLVY